MLVGWKYSYYSSSHIGTKDEKNYNPSNYMAYHLYKCLKQTGFSDIHAFSLAENTDAKLQIILLGFFCLLILKIKLQQFRSVYLFKHIIKY